MMNIGRKTYMIIVSWAMLLAYQANGQDEAGAVDRSDVYMGEAIGRASIDASEIPLEVMKSFEKSEFSDMQIERVHRLEAIPTSDSAEAYSSPQEDSLIEGNTMQDTDILDSAYTDRPVDMREETSTDREKFDIAQTYYQDTYEDTTEQKDEMYKEEQRSADAQETSEVETNTYYEIEVSGEKINYVLLFDEEGNLHHSEAQEM